MNYTSLKLFLTGILVGIFLTCALLFLFMSIGNPEKNDSPTVLNSPTPNQTEAPIVPQKPFEDEDLASDIIISGKKIHDMYEHITNEISEGDLNGAMLTLNIQYSEEFTEAKNRANNYHISPEGKVMLNSWLSYLDELPMILYRTQMQIDNIGKNYYAKAHAEKISADKILTVADNYLNQAMSEAKKRKREPEELHLNRVKLPLSNKNV
ncbi:hypothetical protein [Methanospirillum hungatei]|uniref:hypothetical protein n=1 Tax=Methanospirillum hungatei TaxID=2203 RepID=UPI0026EEE7C8|nr:hypothetical protein [Methanospirillum hungatei]MCA1917058.1 hypothetical protein [Methanospirillum hungatei]